MRIDGRWISEPDGGVRPLIWAKVQDPSGQFVEVEFLVDSGADQTVLGAMANGMLNLDPVSTDLRLGGAGGMAEARGVSARLLFVKSDQRPFAINTECFVFEEENELETCILGRDVLNLFTVIFDYNNRLVCLLAPNHAYSIQGPQ